MEYAAVWVVSAVVAVGAATGGASATTSQTQTCRSVGQSAHEVLPGTTLTWDSSSICTGAPDTGRYSFTVLVRNSGTSTQGVTLTDVKLTHTTPRPVGQEPDAAGSAPKLPVTVRPGESVSFAVRGSYALVGTDDGDKANLHFQASGEGLVSGDPFVAGVNALLRGSRARGTTDSSGSAPPKDEGEGAEERGDRPGPPAWVPGPR